ncbi:hypothetical protein BaRGS_00029613, partial [Batillaria attramentaria]
DVLEKHMDGLHYRFPDVTLSALKPEQNESSDKMTEFEDAQNRAFGRIAVMRKLMEQVREQHQAAVSASTSASPEHKAKLNDIKLQMTAVEKLLDKVDVTSSAPNAVGKAIDVQFAGAMNKMKNALPYERARWVATGVLLLVPTVVAELTLAGMWMGWRETSVDTDPTKRSDMSDFGARLLFAGMGIMFIFIALLVLLWVVMFTAGSFSERYVCQTFQDPQKIEEYVAEYERLEINLSNYTIPSQYGNITLDLSETME